MSSKINNIAYLHNCIFLILRNDFILATVCWLSNGVAVCATALQRRSAPSGKWKLQLTLQLGLLAAQGSAIGKFVRHSVSLSVSLMSHVKTFQDSLSQHRIGFSIIGSEVTYAEPALLSAGPWQGSEAPLL